MVKLAYSRYLLVLGRVVISLVQRAETKNQNQGTRGLMARMWVEEAVFTTICFWTPTHTQRKAKAGHTEN